jgi:hypothetical protein
MKKAKVKYIKDYIDNEGVLLPDEGYKNVVMSHTKRYHNCLFLLVGLRGCSRDLMDFLTEQMDNDNLVRSDSIIRKKFMDFVNGITKGEVTYSEPSVKRAFRVLEEKGLIRSQTRGVFRVNPEYFIKNDDTKRLDLIKLELEFTMKSTRINVNFKHATNI